MANTITIDGEKLRALLRAKKTNAAQASRDIGMSDSYLSNCIGYNYIAKAQAMLLEAKYGIMIDDYKYVEPEKPSDYPAEVPVAITPQSGMTNDDWNRIAAMITAAVPAIDYDRITKSVADGFMEGANMLLTSEPVTRQIQQTLYAAIHGALKKIANERK